MAKLVTLGALMTCTMGAAPAPFVTSPKNRVLGPSGPAGNIADMVPGANIPPFGLCSSIANPLVAAATLAALGALTPMACTPVPAAPWTPGASKVLLGGMPALTDGCKCMCAYGGQISFTTPGQFVVDAA